jgi:hypothetical protein
MANENGQLPDWLGRLLCLLGFHDFRLVESIGGFGVGGQVEKLVDRLRRWNVDAAAMLQRGMVRQAID